MSTKLENNENNLNRFISAQDSCFEKVKEELKDEDKKTCWMWYIFPQIKGLGRTEMANYYGIDDIKEAKEYLNNKILKERMECLCNILLKAKKTDPEDIFHYPDHLKFRSSLTLFLKASKNNDIYQKLLDKFFKGIPDQQTLFILEEQNKKLKLNNNSDDSLNNETTNEIKNDKQNDIKNEDIKYYKKNDDIKNVNNNENTNSKFNRKYILIGCLILIVLIIGLIYLFW